MNLITWQVIISIIYLEDRHTITTNKQVLINLWQLLSFQIANNESARSTLPVQTTDLKIRFASLWKPIKSCHKQEFLANWQSCDNHPKRNCTEKGLNLLNWLISSIVRQQYTVPCWFKNIKKRLYNYIYYLPDWCLLPHIWLLCHHLHDFVPQFLNVICFPFLLWK